MSGRGWVEPGIFLLRLLENINIEGMRRYVIYLYQKLNYSKNVFLYLEYLWNSR
jgi:hypothetical protein